MESVNDRPFLKKNKKIIKKKSKEKSKKRGQIYLFVGNPRLEDTPHQLLFFLNIPYLIGLAEYPVNSRLTVQVFNNLQFCSTIHYRGNTL